MSNIYGVSRKRIVGETWFWILMAIVAVLAIAALTFGIRWVTAGPKGALQAREQIQSGPNRIAQYDHFFDLCAAVQTDEATIASLRQELGTNPSVSRTGQIQASLTALRSGRAEKINQYNADARKNYTAGQFRSSDLPFQLQPTVEATTCAA